MSGEPGFAAGVAIGMLFMVGLLTCVRGLVRQRCSHRLTRVWISAVKRKRVSPAVEKYTITLNCCDCGDKIDRSFASPEEPEGA